MDMNMNISVEFWVLDIRRRLFLLGNLGVTFGPWTM